MRKQYVSLIIFLLLGAALVPGLSSGLDETYQLNTINMSSDVYTTNTQVDPDTLGDNQPEITSLKKSFSFKNIQTSKNEYGTIFTLDGLNQHYIPGKPILPMESHRILLPQGTTLDDIQVIPGPVVTLPGRYDIAPAPKVVPLSYEGDLGQPIEKNEVIYGSSQPYPASLCDVVSVQHKMGYMILILNVFPVQYLPLNQTVLFYPDLDIDISLVEQHSSDTIRCCRLSYDDQKTILDNIQNIEMLESYSSEFHNDFVDQDLVEYVVVTNEELRDSEGKYTFQDLVQSKRDKGLTADIVTVEEITATPKYWWDGAYGDRQSHLNDTACQIRNFIKDAYENMGTRFVLLGGDGDGADVGGESGDNIIPARLFYVSEYFGQSTIAADMYYSCLDGCFDANGDGVFGEYGDGIDIDPEGEVDLCSEVYIGRAPVDNEEELSNFVRKTLAYEASNDIYLRNVTMVGEHLGFGGDAEFGAYSKDEIRYGSDLWGYITSGIPDFYDVSTLYDKDWMDPLYDWPKEELFDIIDSGVHIINHLGHGNNFRVMKLYEPVRPLDVDVFIPYHDVTENLTNENYFFGYSQACFPGSFDNKWPDDWGGEYLPCDSIVEHLIGSEHGAFAFIANSRYGYGMTFSTNGPSQNFDREFFDALYGEDIRQLGPANQDSKEDNINKIGNVVVRFCYYELNLFGDPEQILKIPPLREHDLSVSNIDIPCYVWINESFIINATIRNNGKHNEDNIVISFFFNESYQSSICIPSLGSQESALIQFIFSYDMIGRFPLAIEVSVVEGEEKIDNNHKITEITFISQEPVKACVLDGLITDVWPFMFDYLNNKWYLHGNIPTIIDLNTLNKDDITYDDLCSSGADLLIIEGNILSSYASWMFTLDEIDAITRYVNDGHGLFILWDSFGTADENNWFLLPLVGLENGPPVTNYYDTDGCCGGSCPIFTLDILNSDHPLFTSLEEPVVLQHLDTIMPQDDSWDDNELRDTGNYLAHVTNDSTGNNIAAFVVNENNAVYSSMGLEYTDCPNTMQLLYNSVIFTGNGTVNPSLNVNIRGHNSEYITFPMSFESYVFGGERPLTYSWDFGDGNHSNEQNPTYTYQQSGIYTILLSVTDANGLSGYDTFTVDIQPIQPMNVHFGYDAPYTELLGAEIRFEGYTLGGICPIEYLWDFGDGNISHQIRPRHTYSQAHNYTVTLTARDARGVTATNTSWANILYMSLDIQAPAESSVHTPIAFTSFIEGGKSPYVYHWEFGDGNTSTDPNPIYSYTRPGHYTVSLTVTDTTEFSINTTCTIIIFEPLVENTNKHTYYNTIQQAIDDADSYDTLFIYANNTFEEQIIIDKPLTITGENQTNTILEAIIPQYTIKIKSGGVTITNLTIINTFETGLGIFATVGLNICIENNTFIGNSGINIQPFSTPACIITKNQFLDSSYLYISRSGENIITHNTFEKTGILSLGPSYSNYEHTICEHNTIDGKPLIYIYSESDLILDSEVGQIIAVNCQNIKIQDHTWKDTFSPIQLINSQNIDIINCLIQNCKCGVYIDQSEIVNITQIFIQNEGSLSTDSCGILIKSHSDYININNSVITGFDYGIHIYNSKRVTITKNIMQQCEDAMYVSNTEENINIFENIFYQNTRGIYLWCIYSGIVTIYHNTFIDNQNNAYDTSNSNTWYNDTLQEGNYWDDYTGSDNNGDGIGDIPYDIDGGENQDIYPLMNPYIFRNGDINNDGKVNIIDLGSLLSIWGVTIDEPIYDIVVDINLDGMIDISDLGILLANWTG